MQKVWKKFAVLVSVFCLALTAAIFCACGDSAEKETYTVKVVLPDGDDTPVPGVELTFSEEADETKTQKPVKTDKNGKVVVTYKKADYRVKVTGGLPEGYTLLNADSETYCTRNWVKSACLITLDKTEGNYTVTVVRQGGSNVAGVDVIFTPDSSAAETLVRTTDENGKVQIALSATLDYVVTLDATTLPSGFAVKPEDANGISTANGAAITFTLVPEQTYSVQVNGPAGVSLEGIAVSYAATANGFTTLWGYTDANGKLSVVKPSSKGYIYITAPNGYAYNENYGDNSPYALKKGTITFQLLKRTDFTLSTAMTESEQQAFVAATTSNFAAMMSEAGRAAYCFSAQIGAGETQVFSFTAQQSERYDFFASFSDCEVKLFDSLKFKAGNIDYSIAELPDKSMGMYVEAEAGATYFFTVSATTAQTVQLVIVTPADKNDYSAEGAGDYTLTIKNKQPAMLYFRPAQSGEYTLTIASGASGYRIDQISQANHDPIIGAGSDNGSVVFQATDSELFDGNGKPTPNVWIFRFTSTAATPAYPIEISVTIERTGDAFEKQKVTENAVVTERLTQYADQTGKLTAVGVTGAQVVKGGDGYYHYGNANGPVVVIKLKGAIPPFYVGEENKKLDFSTLDKEDIGWYTFYKNSDDTHYYFVNYASFLRGYTAYSDNPTIEVEEYYLKYVNKDGVYPLNDELKVFLQYVARNNASWLSGSVSNAQSDCLWLFSAYYYDDAAETAASEIDLTAWKKED